VVKASAAQVVDGRVDHFCIKNFAGLLGDCLSNVMIVDSKSRNVTCIAGYDGRLASSGNLC
jgi:hypothetical protein